MPISLALNSSSGRLISCGEIFCSRKAGTDSLSMRVMLPGGSPKSAASTTTRFSTPSRYCSRSRPQVPPSSSCTSAGRSGFVSNRWMTRTPTPSSESSRLPTPKIKVFGMSLIHHRDLRDLFALGIQHVHGAGHAGVKGVDRTQDFERFLGIGHAHAHQGGFVGAWHVVGVARRAV